MINRHLAPVSNPIVRFRFIHTDTEGLRKAFEREITEKWESWRSRKSQVKIARIDSSLAEEDVDFTRVKFMIKKESSAWPYSADTAIKKARGIQFAVNERSAYEYVEEFDAFSGALAEESKKTVEVGGVKILIRYASKMNHEEMGEFATESEELRGQFPYSLVDERDGKNWDANVQVPHREALCGVYEKLGGSQFAAYVRSGIRVRGAFVSKNGETRIAYTVDGTVKSGHGDTSCGNGALNREISMQAVLLLPEHLRPALVRGMVVGDDYIAWLYFDHVVDPAELCSALNGAEQWLGIHPVRGLFRRLEHASFISLGFYRAHDGRTFVALPKIGRLLCRLFWTVTETRGRDPRRLASGIAQSFYPLYNTNPLMRKFLKYHMQVPPIDFPEADVYYRWAEIGTTRLPVPIDWDENNIVKYGFTTSDVDFPEMGAQGAALMHNILVDRMYQIDTMDPDERPGNIGGNKKDY